MLIYLAMFFVVFEILSIIFNPFFLKIFIFGFVCPFNISVAFFCFCFFILDLVTEVYGKKTSDKFIYGKIFSQIIFVFFGHMGVIWSGTVGSQLNDIISQSSSMVFHSAIATFFSYHLTTGLMSALKIRYDGRFLMLRYLVSTMPGEILFSLIFSALNFSSGKSFDEWFFIFLSLSLTKLLFSCIFSFSIVPVTLMIKRAANLEKSYKHFAPLM